MVMGKKGSMRFHQSGAKPPDGFGGALVGLEGGVWVGRIVAAQPLPLCHR